MLAPDGLSVVAALIRFDMPIMLAAAVACLPIFATGHLIARWEGILFLSYYCVYTSYLILTPHYAEPVQLMSIVMLLLVLPLTFITLALLWFRQGNSRSSD